MISGQHYMRSTFLNWLDITRSPRASDSRRHNRDSKSGVKYRTSDCLKRLATVEIRSKNFRRQWVWSKAWRVW